MLSRYTVLILCSQSSKMLYTLLMFHSQPCPFVEIDSEKPEAGIVREKEDRNCGKLQALL